MFRLPEREAHGVQAALGLVALTFGIFSGAVSAVSAIGWLSDLPWLITAGGPAFGAVAPTLSLLMIAGFASTSILLLRGARRLLK
ncbi:MAG TPA: hypothetical protein VGL66_04950 [Caulobacteraceae bacterium]